MKIYKSKKSIIVAMDILAMIISFIFAVGVRFNLLKNAIGVKAIYSYYVTFFIGMLLIYGAMCLIRRKASIERMSYRDILVLTVEQQVLFIVVYVFFFFIFKQTYNISRIVIGLFFIGNVILCSAARCLYHMYCVKKSIWKENEMESSNHDQINGIGDGQVRHCYIAGSKSIGQYGGYESFVLNLLQQHKDNEKIKYHVACKANGQGYMNLDKLPGAERINDSEFNYCNAHCFLIRVPEKLGSAQAIYYDLRALRYICEHIENNHIENPIVYILASRVGPFEKKYVDRIHEAGGLVYQNPDGHEDWRRKWSPLIRKYWKFSERYAVKNSDLVVCDSKNIESYIQDEYSEYNPKTTFIAYGSYINPSKLEDNDPKYKNWLKSHGLKDGNFYISVGRFVEENNFEIMIREFMLSNTKKDFAIITTDNPKYAEQLQQKLNYKKDRRIKFVGTVYDSDLLAKIRANAYGYFHGHEVGGTNPSLLEALGSTNLNLLLNVGFNKEVAEEAALYWGKEEGDLAKLIDKADEMSAEDRLAIGEKAKQRIREEYSWEYICGKYEGIFL